MSDDDTPTYRTHTQPTGDAINVRQPEGTDDVFDVRLPIATTGEVRNEGDDPLTRTELEGMADQIAAGGVGVFLDHGGSAHGGGARYGATEKLGEWVDPELRDGDDGETELVATARLMDPVTLPEAVGPIRQALAAIREQVDRGMSVAASIGWSDAPDSPGGVDLMEASLVGIPADPRTQSDAGTVGMLARAAVDAGADAEALVGAVRDAVTNDDMTDDTDPEPDTGHDAEDEPDADDGETREKDDYAERLKRIEEYNEQEVEMIGEIRDALREDGYDDKEGDDGEQSADEPDSEQSADTEDAGDDDDGGVSERVAELEAELADLRENGLSSDDVETPEPEDEQDADADDGDTAEPESDRDGDSGPSFSFAAPNTED